MREVSIKSLRKFCHALLKKCAVPEEDVQIIMDSIIYADTRGKWTHGITRLPIYVKKIQDGLMSPNTKIKVIKESPVITVLDADHGFGQVAAYKGMKLCIEKARKFGIGMVGIRKSNNFGAAGFIAEIPTQNEMIGIVLANSAPAIAPWGGFKPILGTNPIGIAFPGNKNHYPVTLDMATSFAARGKIRLAAKNKEKIPFGWALDEFGKPTDDPETALKGSMIPIGEHKGYGLSLVVDILAGLLTGAAFGGDTKPLGHPDGYSDYGHLLMAINVSFFMDIDDYYSKLINLENKIKSAGEEGSVSLPGEKSWNQAQSIKKKMTFENISVEELNQLALELGLNERI